MRVVVIYTHSFNLENTIARFLLVVRFTPEFSFQR